MSEAQERQAIEMDVPIPSGRFSMKIVYGEKLTKKDLEHIQRHLELAVQSGGMEDNDEDTA